MLALTLNSTYLNTPSGHSVWDILRGEPAPYRKDVTQLELMQNFLEAHPDQNRLFCDESMVTDLKRLGFSAELMSIPVTLEDMLSTLDEKPSWYVSVYKHSIVALCLSQGNSMVYEKDTSNIEQDAEIIVHGIPRNNTNARFDFRSFDHYSLTQKRLLALAFADGLMHSPVFRAGHVAIFDCDSSYFLKMSVE